MALVIEMSGTNKIFINWKKVVAIYMFLCYNPQITILRDRIGSQ